MLPADINDPVAKDTYINRVQTLTKEMASQVDFAVKRENHMRRTLDAAREFWVLKCLINFILRRMKRL